MNLLKIGSVAKFTNVENKYPSLTLFRSGLLTAQKPGESLESLESL